jgi:hypothetical protein
MVEVKNFSWLPPFIFAVEAKKKSIKKKFIIMKKVFTLLSFILINLFIFGQTVDRNKVIVEIGTGTGCPYCPGAAMGADDLIANGKQVGIIEYHNYNSGDPFNNPYAAARCSYYGISGYPTAIFDGTLTVVGGSNSSSLYTSYLSKYNQRIAIPSDFTIDVSGSSSGNEFSITVVVNNVNNNTMSNLRLQVALTESEIPYNWQGQNHLNFVERLMLPDANGTMLDFSGGNMFSHNYTFSLEEDWVFEHCQLVIFVQNHSNKEILQGTTMDLENFLSYNASAMNLSMPNAVCGDQLYPVARIKNSGSETLTSLDIEYHVNEEDVYTYAWTGSLDLGEYEDINLPAMTIDDMLDENTLSFTVSNPNGNPDELLQDNTASTSFEKAQNFDNPPNMKLFIKTDNNPEETTWELKNGIGEVIQSGGPYDQAMHLYIVDFNITENDCYSFTIYDAGGNGFTLSASKYYIIYGTGQIFITNNDFGYKEETQFGVGLVGVENNLLHDNIKIFPNPVSHEAFIMYETSSPSSIQMKMFDTEGKLVMTYSEKNQNPGVHSIRINANDFANGIYFVNLLVNKKSYQKKIIITK